MVSFKMNVIEAKKESVFQNKLSIELFVALKEFPGWSLAK